MDTEFPNEPVPSEPEDDDPRPVTATYQARITLRGGDVFAKDLAEIIERAIYAHQMIDARVTVERLDR